MRVRVLTLILSTWVLAHALACGGTVDVANDIVAPTPLTGCEQTVSPSSQSAPASGGSFAVDVTTREGCNWTAETDDSWISITRGNGSGSGSAAYTVAPNAGTAARQGRVRVGNRAVAVTQPGTPSAAPAPPVPAPPSPAPPAPAPPAPPAPAPPAAPAPTPPAPTPPAPPDPSPDPSDPTPEPSDPTPEPSDPTPDPPAPRECVYSFDPTSQPVGVNGGTFETTLTAGPECSWTVTATGAASMAQVSASGRRTLTYSVAPNAGGRRDGKLEVRIATSRVPVRTFTITQAGCSYELRAPAAVSASGGSASVQMTTNGSGCRWSALSPADKPWIRVNDPAPQTGSRAIALTIERNTAPATRDARIDAGGQFVTVTQAAAAAVACPASFELTRREPVPALGARGLTIAVKAAPDCKWAASIEPTRTPWITIRKGEGVGDGGVSFDAAENTGAARSETIRIGEKSVLVSQMALAPSLQINILRYACVPSSPLLEVEIVDQSGARIPGVSVEVLPVTQVTPSPSTAITDAAGRALFTRLLAAQQYRVRVELVGFATVTRLVDCPATTPIGAVVRR